MEMKPKLEKVIRGLECCREMENPPGWRVGGCEDCPYKSLKGKDGCTSALKEDAISLLKAQEPRVLTIEEVEALEEGTIVWVEENYGGQRYLNPMVCNGDRLFGNYYLGIDMDIWLCDGKKDSGLPNLRKNSRRLHRGNRRRRNHADPAHQEKVV